MNIRKRTITKEYIRRLVLGVFGTGLVLVASNCAKPVYPACESDAECAEHSEICVDKKCVQCMSDSDCVTKMGAGASCESNRCIAKASSKLSSSACKTDQDCGPNSQCQNTRCVAQKNTTCKSDKECAADQSCVQGTCGSKISSTCKEVMENNQITVGNKVLFEYNRAEITLDSKNVLDKLAACLKETNNKDILVEGHTDERGTTEYNLSLGEQRAQSVVKYLERSGVETKAMRTVSKGKNQPVCNESTEECYSKNRRVEFKN